MSGKPAPQGEQPGQAILVGSKSCIDTTEIRQFNGHQNWIFISFHLNGVIRDLQLVHSTKMELQA